MSGTATTMYGGVKRRRLVGQAASPPMSGTPRTAHTRAYSSVCNGPTFLECRTSKLRNDDVPRRAGADISTPLIDRLATGGTSISVAELEGWDGCPLAIFKKKHSPCSPYALSSTYDHSTWSVGESCVDCLMISITIFFF